MPVRARVRLRVRVHVREHHEKTRVAIHSDEFQVARQLVRGLSEKGSVRTAIPTRVLGGGTEDKTGSCCLLRTRAGSQTGCARFSADGASSFSFEIALQHFESPPLRVPNVGDIRDYSVD